MTRRPAKTGKRPAFQLYPGDWQRDLGLRSRSMAARGLWIEMMCLMHDGHPYGHLQVGDQRLDDPVILAPLVSSTPQECARLLAELEAVNVFSRTRKGVVFSRRMVRDEAIREKKASAGKLGGNPALLNHGDNQTVNHRSKQNLTPASASASSSSVSSIEPSRLVRNVPPDPSNGNGTDGVYQNVNQQPLTEEEKLVVGPLLADIVEVTRDDQPKSRMFFVKIARSLDQRVVRRIIAEVRDAVLAGGIRNAGALFNSKATAEMRRAGVA